MSKCEHGQKITTFCATECCVWKEAGGCSSCMKKYHNHMGPTVFVSEEEANRLVNRYHMEPSVKPKCRNLQQLVFNYFNLIKTEFDTYIDNTCIDIVNKIGYPYLTENNLFNTYKRLKKKDFKKVQQRDFRTFYEMSRKVDNCELIDKEGIIYIEKVKEKYEFINRIEGLIRNFQKENKENESSYMMTHDDSLHLRINEMVHSIVNSNEGQDHKEHKQKAFTKRNVPEKQKILSSEKLQEINSGRVAQFPQSVEHGEGKHDNIREEHDNQHLQVPRRHRLRANSIDQQLIKNSKLQKKKQGRKQSDAIASSSQTAAERQVDSSQSSISKVKNDSQSPSPRKKYFDTKEVEISQKKQKLIDMMKQKNESHASRVHQTNLNQLHVPTSSHGDAGRSENKLSERSADDQDSFDLKDDQKPHHFAHAVLPRTQSMQKIFQQRVAQKTVIVAVENSIEASQFEQCQSPLLKHKFKSKERESSVTKEQQTEQFQIIPKKTTDYEAKVEEQADSGMSLSEQQEQSVAFLIKSFHLKPSQAIPYLQKALECSQDNLSAAEYLSYLYLQINSPKQCLDLCNKTLEKLRDSTDRALLSKHLSINKSSSLNLLGRYSQSILISEEYLKHEPSERIYKNLGDAYYSIGILEKATYSYEKSVNLCDDYDEAHYNLAVCLFSQKNYYNAKFSIAKALKYNANNSDYLQLQNEINERIKKY